MRILRGRGFLRRVAALTTIAMDTLAGAAVTHLAMLKSEAAIHEATTGRRPSWEKTPTSNHATARIEIGTRIMNVAIAHYVMRGVRGKTVVTVGSTTKASRS